VSVGAVVVDFHAGEVLRRCLESLRQNDIGDIVVVENGEQESSQPFIGSDVRLVVPGLNLGYGRGVNRGLAFLKNDFVVISNPDVVVHPGAVAELLKVAEHDPLVAIVGPTIVTSTGEKYPSHRKFPSPFLAALHAVLAPLWPNNPATKKYRSANSDGSVDWVSGAFFLARREALELVGGFDESYFMFAEDMALCWLVARAGYKVVTCESAVVTHIEGVSRAKTPRAMIGAHHRSALRFEMQTARGVRRLLIPVAAALLGLRYLLVLATSGRRLSKTS
jgi:N-acetylglucosaminyl-diphospho-decaprenol L-rhamnosyltransferase